MLETAFPDYSRLITYPGQSVARHDMESILQFQLELPLRQRFDLTPPTERVRALIPARLRIRMLSLVRSNSLAERTLLRCVGLHLLGVVLDRVRQISATLGREEGSLESGGC